MRLADLFVGIKADTADLKKELTALPKNMSAAGKKGAAGFTGQIKQSMASLKTSMKQAISPQALATGGIMAGAAAFGALAAGIGQAVKDLINIERLGAQTNAVIRSTGGAANVTRDQVDELAQSIETLSGIEAESVTEGQNLLLTFTNIRNQAGAGNNIFDKATEAMVDYSVAMGTDAKGAAIQLGKALNDPIKGLNALGRAGVTFSDAQKQMIKQMVAAGDVMGAQKVILAELEKQFGGSAEAFGTTWAGKLKKAENSIGDFFEAIVVDAGTALDEFGGAANDMAMNFGDMGTRVHALADKTGQDFTDLKENIRAEMIETGQSFDQVMTGMEMDATLAAHGITDAMSEGVRFASDALRSGGPVIAEEAGKIAGMFPSELRAQVEAIRQVGRDSVLALATGILERQNDPLLAIDALKKVMDSSMSDVELIGKLTGEDTMALLRAALTSDLTADRIAAQEALQPIIDTLNMLGPEGRAAALRLLAGLADGFRSASAKESAKEALREAGREIVGVFPFSEPKDPKSPFRGITKWNPLKSIIDNMAASGPSFAAATRQALSGMDLTGMSGFHASRMTAATPMKVAPGGVAGGPTFVTHINLNMLNPPNTPIERQRIGQAVAGAVESAFVRNGRFPRRGTRSGV